MQGSKTPTLSISKKPTKVFGRKNDGSSVVSETSQVQPRKTIQLNTKPQTPAEKGKRQSKIPSHMGSATKPRTSNINSEVSFDSFDETPEPESTSSRRQSNIPVSPNFSTNSTRKRSTPSQLSLNRPMSSNISVSSRAKQSDVEKPPSPYSFSKQSTPMASKSPSPSPSPKRDSPQSRRKKSPTQASVRVTSKDLDDEDQDFDNRYANSSFQESPKSSKKPAQENNDDEEDSPIVISVNELLNDEAPSDKIYSALEELDEWQLNITSVASPIETQQQLLWYNSMISLLQQQNLYVEQNKVSFYSELVDLSRKFLKSHRFSFPGGTSHRFKAAILGPNGSGKSTFLSVMAQQYLIGLLTSSEWKHTFVFPLDTAMISPYFENLQHLYCMMVQLTFNALSAQRPLLIQYTEALIHSFQSVTTGAPVLPKSFVLDEDFRLITPAIKQLLDIITQCWNDSSAMMSFIVNIFMFPFFISNIFGFSKFVVIADHLDLSDVTKTPTHPFEESEENVFLAEIFKYMLNESSYIVSGKNSFILMNLLTTADTQSKGLCQTIETLSTLSIVQPSEDDNYSYNVAFVGDEPPPLQLTAKQIGGCPFYHLKWREINLMSQRISEMEEEEDVEEDKLTRINLIQALLRQIITNADGTPYNASIKSVTSCQQKKKE